MNSLIRFGQQQWSGDPKTDIRILAELVQKEFDNVYKYLVAFPQVSGTFKSADSPQKTITVTNGIVTGIK